jgi:hypothetical protein
METKIKMEKIEKLVKTNIQKSMDWCNKYGIPHYILNTNTNIFLSNGSNIYSE